MDNIAPNKDISRFISSYGLEDGEYMKSMISKILIDAGFSKNITLSSLKRYVKKEFILVTTKLSTQEIVYLRAETHPNLEVVDAIFMSMCIPFLFKPVEYHQELYVDGALLMSLPDYFDPEKTLVIDINDKVKGHKYTINSWQEYLFVVTTCGSSVQKKHKETYMEKSTNINIILPYISPVDFNLHISYINKLIRIGYMSFVTFVYPNFCTSMEQTLRVVLSYLLQIASNEYDEHDCGDL